MTDDCLQEADIKSIQKQIQKGKTYSNVEYVNYQVITTLVKKKKEICWIKKKIIKRSR